MSVPLSSIVEAWLHGKDPKKIIQALLELSRVHKIINKEKDIRFFFFSPIVDTDSKKDVLKLARLSPEIQTLIAWVDRKRWWDKMPQLVREGERYLERLIRAREAKVVSAVPLDAQEISTLKKRLEKAIRQKISIITKVEPEILGGLVVDLEGKRYDSSLKGRLIQMRKSVNKLSTA